SGARAPIEGGGGTPAVGARVPVGGGGGTPAVGARVPAGGGEGVPAAPVVIRSTDLVRAVVDDLRRGVPSPVIAARFHHGLAGAVVTAAGLVARAAGIGTVALSGGVFANELLLGGVADGLRARGFRVLTHRRVPCNDGGISLGQAAVAAAAP
ncbi:carbamoyltransferase HypF, partial [Nonomuraea sp. NPDC050691]